MAVKRTLIIRKMDEETYLVSVRYLGSKVNRTENRFILKKKGGKYALDYNNNNIYIPNATLMSILKDVVFMKAFKDLLKSGKDKIEVSYTLTADDYVNVLNKFIKG